MLVYIASKTNQYILLHTLFLLILVFIKHFLALLLYYELLPLQRVFLWRLGGEGTKGLETTICCARMNWQHSYVVHAHDGVGPSLTNQSWFRSQRNTKATKCPFWIFHPNLHSVSTGITQQGWRAATVSHFRRILQELTVLTAPNFPH